MTTPVPRDSERRSSRTGTRTGAIVGAGFLVSGVASYGFLVLAARALGPARYAPLAAFWSLAFLIGPGVFSVSEKEATRRISAGLAVKKSDGPVTRRIALIGLLTCFALVLVGVVCESFLRLDLFNGSWIMFAALTLSLPSIFVQYMAEGVVIGNSRFTAYSAVISAEGVARLAGAVLLVLVGVRTAGPFGLVVAIAPALSVLVAVPTLRRSTLGGQFVDYRTLLRSIAWLVGGSLGLTIMVNSGTVLAKALAHGESSEIASRFLAGMVLVRVPLFLYNSVAATALPALAADAASNHWDSFNHKLNRLLGWVCLLGLVTTGAAGLIGRSLIRLVFGTAYDLPSPDLAALAGSVAALLVATTLTVAMQAIGQEKFLCLCWGLGVAVMAACAVALHPLLQRIEVGLLAGSLTACVAMGVTVFGVEVTRRRHLHAVASPVDMDVMTRPKLEATPDTMHS